MNIFGSGKRKIIVLSVLYFIGLFCFLKKNNLCNIITNRVHEIYFLFKVRKHYIPNSAYSVSLDRKEAM